MEQRQSFQQMVLEQLDIYVQKIKIKGNLDTDLTPFTKTKSKWITDLNVKQETIKLLEDNIGENLDDLGYGDDFLDITPKIWSVKEIIDKLDFIKMKNLGFPGGTVVKNPPANVGDTGLSPGPGRSHMPRSN